jgi:hypothetical protein
MDAQHLLVEQVCKFFLIATDSHLVAAFALLFQFNITAMPDLCKYQLQQRDGISRTTKSIEESLDAGTLMGC